MSKLTILVNLGTPDQPFEKEVRTYLREFLSDKYVIRLPRIFWLTLLNLVILGNLLIGLISLNPDIDVTLNSLFRKCLSHNTLV